MSALVGVHAEAWGDAKSLPARSGRRRSVRRLCAASKRRSRAGIRFKPMLACEGRQATTQSPRRSLAQRVKIASASASLGDRSGGSPR